MSNAVRTSLILLMTLILGGISSSILFAGEPHPHDLVNTTDSNSITHQPAAATQLQTEQRGLQVAEEVPGLFYFLLSGKYLAFLILILAGFSLLLGRLVKPRIRFVVMLGTFVLFGLDYIFPLHPSPMCATTKLFMFSITWRDFFPAFTAMVLAIFIPSLVGRKLFCGWVCPLGALQELANKVPFKFKFKQFSFGLFNGVRMALLVSFVMVFFAVKDHVAFLAERTGADITTNIWTAFSAFSIYEPINFFELLHWRIDTLFIVMFTVLIIGSLILYRPFCYAICPIGALSWLFEKISPWRVRIDRAKCNQCGDCIERSPCPTIKPMVESPGSVLPDCTSCGECLTTCSSDAIKFSIRR